MTDVTSSPARPRASSGRSIEFHVYFAMIFLLALPFGSFRWLRDIVRFRTLNLRGPLARAWAEADRITPFIFSA